MTYTHFSAEGEVSFKAILFVPKQAERDMFNDYGQKKGDNIKVIYVYALGSKCQINCPGTFSRRRRSFLQSDAFHS